jgi:hypothetical protein
MSLGDGGGVIQRTDADGDKFYCGCSRGYGSLARQKRGIA